MSYRQESNLRCVSMRNSRCRAFSHRHQRPPSTSWIQLCCSHLHSRYSAIPLSYLRLLCRDQTTYAKASQTCRRWAINLGSYHPCPKMDHSGHQGELLSSSQASTAQLKRIRRTQPTTVITLTSKLTRIKGQLLRVTRKKSKLAPTSITWASMATSSITATCPRLSQSCQVLGCPSLIRYLVR